MSSLEVRTIQAPIEAIEAQDRQQLAGYAATYDNLSEDLGGFREIIRPGAFRLREDVRALFSHDSRSLLGRTKNNSLQLTLDDKGVRFALDLPDTSLGRDVAALVRRGDLDSMSFGFVATRDRWGNAATGTVRELLGADLHEISIVAEPAYGGTTVSMRAIERAHEMSASRQSSDLDIRLKIAQLLYISS